MKGHLYSDTCCKENFLLRERLCEGVKTVRESKSVYLSMLLVQSKGHFWSKCRHFRLKDHHFRLKCHHLRPKVITSSSTQLTQLLLRGDTMGCF